MLPSRCTLGGVNNSVLSLLRIVRYAPDWLPGAGWKAKAKRYANLLDDMANIPHQLVKDQIVSRRSSSPCSAYSRHSSQTAGTAVPSFTSELLDGNAVTPETEHTIKWSAASLYSGKHASPDFEPEYAHEIHLPITCSVSRVNRWSRHCKVISFLCSRS